MNLLRLGSLACYYDTDSDLAPELSSKLLPQLDECDNPQSNKVTSSDSADPNPDPSYKSVAFLLTDTASNLVLKLKQRLVRSMVSKRNLTQIARDFGSSISYLSPENVSAISWSDLMEIQQNTSVQWTPAQMFYLVKKRLQGMMVSGTRWTDKNTSILLVLIVAVSQCKQMTSEEILDLKSLAGGLPSCVLKKVTAMKMLMDKKELRNITRRMRRGQLKAVLQRVSDECGLNARIKDERHIRVQ